MAEIQNKGRPCPFQPRLPSPRCRNFNLAGLSGTANALIPTNPSIWYLEEKISGCVYRAVSKDRKLTNCFWNFYRRPPA